jgi:hypothetical protein
MLKKTRHRLKRLFKRKRKTRRMRGGETPIELTQEEQRTNKIVKGVVTDVMKELKKEGVLDTKKDKGQEDSQPHKEQKEQKQRQDTFSENRPTGMVEQILLAPLRIPAKLVKLPFKIAKAPVKFVKKLVF